MEKKKTFVRNNGNYTCLVRHGFRFLVKLRFASKSNHQVPLQPNNKMTALIQRVIDIDCNNR